MFYYFVYSFAIYILIAAQDRRFYIRMPLESYGQRKLKGKRTDAVGEDGVESEPDVSAAEESEEEDE